MIVTQTLKEFVRPIISQRIINHVLVSLLKLFRALIPDELLVRVPINGVATCKLTSSDLLSLFSEADDPIVSGLYFKGLDAYEAETIRPFRKLAVNAEVILDIGANTGLYALIAAVENSDANVHAFEPVPRIHQRLEKNRQLNNLNNLQINDCALSNSCERKTLYIPVGKIPTSSSTLKGHRKAHEIIEVKTVTLDAYVQEHAISKVDLIKIDTEATEHLVLEGGLKMIERDRPTIICEVLKTHTGSAIQSLLNGYGYRYFWLTADGLIEESQISGDVNFQYLNHLFIQPERIQIL